MYWSKFTFFAYAYPMVPALFAERHCLFYIELPLCFCQKIVDYIHMALLLYSLFCPIDLLVYFYTKPHYLDYSCFIISLEI